MLYLHSPFFIMITEIPELITTVYPPYGPNHDDFLQFTFDYINYDLYATTYHITCKILVVSPPVNGHHLISTQIHRILGNNQYEQTCPLPISMKDIFLMDNKYEALHLIHQLTIHTHLPHTFH